MNAREIIEKLAREKHVEKLCRDACNRPADQLQDLAQMIYASLLNTYPGIICDLYEKGQLNFYLWRVIKNQCYSTDSEFYRTIKRYCEMALPLGSKEYEKADY